MTTGRRTAATKAEAEKQLAEIRCPECGNSSAVDYSVAERDRPAGARGITCYYPERVYHLALGDFRGDTVVDDDPERYDAPDGKWMFDCQACHHEWPVPETVDLYYVSKVLSHELRVGLMADSHRRLRLRPADFRRGDVVDAGGQQLYRLMAPPEAADGGHVRVAYFLVTGDPLVLPARDQVGSALMAAGQEYDAYRPVGPPECVPADVAEAIDGLSQRLPLPGFPARLVVNAVTHELEVHFTPASVARFMDTVLTRLEKQWWVLEDKVRAANARAIDL